MGFSLIDTHDTGTTIESGKLDRPNRIIWSICEDDIRSIAGDRGIVLTETQLDYVARYVERSLSAVCNWFMLVEMGLDEARQ